MKVLFVEDNASFAAELTGVLAGIAGIGEVVVHGDRDSALTALADDTFDLVVTDLRMPAGPGESDEDVENGLAVYRIAASTESVPIVILSGANDLSIAEELTATSRSSDWLGLDAPQSITRFFEKKNLPACVTYIGDVAGKTLALRDIEIVPPDDLSVHQKRALRLFARQKDGTVVSVERLAGGLSGAITMRLTVSGPNGALRSRCVTKVFDVESVRDEVRRYDKLVSPLLPPGSYAQHISTVSSGADGIGAAFFGLAPGIDIESLFECATRDDTVASQAVERLCAHLSVWGEGAVAAQTTVAEIRRSFVRDDVFLEHVPAGLQATLADLESLSVHTRVGIAHRDLHGENVLVLPTGEAFVIDFARTDHDSIAIDPVTLELSYLLHPASAPCRADWLTLEMARNWFQEDIPEQAHVRQTLNACREWSNAAAASPRERLAVSYGYIARQLQYEDVDATAAVALITSVAEALAATV